MSRNMLEMELDRCYYSRQQSDQYQKPDGAGLIKNKNTSTEKTQFINICINITHTDDIKMGEKTHTYTVVKWIHQE